MLAQASSSQNNTSPNSIGLFVNTHLIVNIPSNRIDVNKKLVACRYLIVSFYIVHNK